jgi:hypothetical protein
MVSGTLDGQLAECVFHGEACDENIFQPHRVRVILCGYSAAHAARGIGATQIINCGPVVGDVPACDKCADFYRRVS